jgi:hypothetical protein
MSEDDIKKRLAKESLRLRHQRYRAKPSTKIKEAACFAKYQDTFLINRRIYQGKVNCPVCGKIGYLYIYTRYNSSTKYLKQTFVTRHSHFENNKEIIDKYCRKNITKNEEIQSINKLPVESEKSIHGENKQ